MSAIITNEEIALDAIANDELGKQAATQLQCFRATTIAEVGGLVPPTDWFGTLISTLAADTRHTTGWGWGQGGQTINRTAKLTQNHVPSDKRDPKIRTPMIHRVVEARQAHIGLHRDEIDPMAFPAGDARQNGVIISKTDDELPDLIAIAKVRSF